MPSTALLLSDGRTVSWASYLNTRGNYFPTIPALVEIQGLACYYYSFAGILQQAKLLHSCGMLAHSHTLIPFLFAHCIINNLGRLSQANSL